MNKWCERCYLRDAKPCAECSTCFPGHRNFRQAVRAQRQTVTNADRIRAMGTYRPPTRQVVEIRIPARRVRGRGLDWRNRKMAKGGMQTSGLQYAIYCKKCGKPAARKEVNGGIERYLHFTRNGSVWHVVQRHEEARHDH